MSRLNITNLQMPEHKYRLDCTTRHPDGQIRFESEADALCEDTRRAKLVAKSASIAAKSKNRRGAAQLANKLDYLARGEDAPETPASAAYMRDQRIRISGFRQ